MIPATHAASLRRPLGARDSSTRVYLYPALSSVRDRPHGAFRALASAPLETFATGAIFRLEILPSRKLRSLSEICGVFRCFAPVRVRVDPRVHKGAQEVLHRDEVVEPLDLLYYTV